MEPAHSFEAALKRDRVLVVAGLATVTIAAWLYLFSIAASMESMSASVGDAMLTGRTAPWTTTEFVLMFLMWAVMMIGMMLPSATPMILLHATVNRRRAERGISITPTAVFALGYAVVWTAFSLLATLAQGGLHQAGLLSPMMATSSGLVGGVVLVAVGLYQWTPFKQSCLRHCQSPLQFITQHWRAGRWGAFQMGWAHGLYCLGCCWFLMALLFVGGVMNLLWIAGLTVFVLLEKVIVRRWVPVVSGGILTAWGLLVLLRTTG